MTETIRIGNIGKLWIPVPRQWDGIGMTNVEIIKISPPPDDLFEDSQGNLIVFWNAGYRGSTDFSITFHVDLAPFKMEIDTRSVGVYDTSSWEYQHYTQPSERIQSADATIVYLAETIAGNTKNPYQKALLIHRWVTQNISVGGDRMDALTTLEAYGGGCGGRSSLFVALLRALGVPARNVGGLHPLPGNHFTSGEFGWRDGGFGTHIWSEFYLTNYGWVQLDVGDSNSFAQLNNHRVILYRGEDIALEHDYPLGTVPVFHMPQADLFLNTGSPRTQTVGENDLLLFVEKLP